MHLFQLCVCLISEFGYYVAVLQLEFGYFVTVKTDSCQGQHQNRHDSCEKILMLNGFCTLCIYAHTHRCVAMGVRVRTHTHASAHAYIHTFSQRHGHAVHKCTQALFGTHTHTHKHTHTHTHAHTHTHTYVHTHTHTHMFTHIHNCTY